MDSRLSPNLLNKLVVSIYPWPVLGEDIPDLRIDDNSDLGVPFVTDISNLTG